MVSFCFLCKTHLGLIPFVSFHSIPKNDYIREKWLNVLGKGVKQHSRVCSRHFKEKDFIYKTWGLKEVRHLKPTAVPSRLIINLNEPNNESKTNEPENPDNEEPDVIIYTLKETLDPNLEPIKGASIQIVDNVDDTNKQRIPKTQCTVDSRKDNSKIEYLDENVHFKRYENIQSSLNFNWESHAEKNSEVRDSLALETNSCSTNYERCERILNEPSEETKHEYISQYVKDMTSEHFTSKRAYSMFINYYCRTKQKRLRLENKAKRLNRKIEHFKTVLDDLSKYIQENSPVT